MSQGGLRAATFLGVTMFRKEQPDVLDEEHVGDFVKSLEKTPRATTRQSNMEGTVSGRIRHMVGNSSEVARKPEREE